MSAVDDGIKPLGKPVRILTPEVSVISRLQRMWAERELLVFMVSRDLSVKYKGSALGFAWSFLNPALTLAIYDFVFSVALHNPVPDFAIYLMCGLVIWNFFFNSVLTACASVVNNSGLIKKVSFSREILVLSSMGTAAVFFFFQAIILTVVLALFHLVPQTPYVYLVPLALVVLIIFTSTLSIFFSAVNVYFRDTYHILEVLLMAWFWATPTVYTWQVASSGLTHHHLTWIYLADPIAPIILLMQRAFYGNPLAGVARTAGMKVPPPAPHTHYLANFDLSWYLKDFGIVILVSSILFVLSLKLFGKLEGNFAEEL